MPISEHKHMPEPVRRMEVFTGAGRRRSWSGAEKAAIVADSYGAGETVCAVARRRALTPQQLFTWRRLARRRWWRRRTQTAADNGPADPRVVADLGPTASNWKSVASEVRVGADAKRRTIRAVIRALKAGS